MKVKMFYPAGNIIDSIEFDAAKEFIGSHVIQVGEVRFTTFKPTVRFKQPKKKATTTPAAKELKGKVYEYAINIEYGEIHKTKEVISARFDGKSKLPGKQLNYVTSIAYDDGFMSTSHRMYNLRGSLYVNTAMFGYMEYNEYMKVYGQYTNEYNN